MDGMILAALAHRDMNRAFEGLQELNKQQQTSALMVMSSQMTMDDVKREQFVQKVEQLEDEEMRNQALQSMVSMWAFQDPRGAVEFVESREWAGEMGADLREGLASSWANSDAEAALTWRLENLAEGEEVAEVVASGFSQWITQDPESAEAWLKAQPDEVKSDNLYSSTADRLRWSADHEGAIEWAAQIENQQQRENSYQRIYQGWREADAEAAQQWLEGLDEATREAVQSLESGVSPAVLEEGFEIRRSGSFEE